MASAPDAADLDAFAEALFLAADAAGIGAMVMDLSTPEATIVGANTAATKLAQRDDIVGESAIQFAAQAERPELTRQAALVARGEPGPPHLVTTLEREARAPVVDIYTSYGTSRGKPVAASFLVGALREAEDALRRAEERFRGLVETISDPVWVGDATTIFYGNPAALRAFGFASLEHALATRPVALVHDEDVSLLEQRMATMLSEQRSLPPFEYRARCQDGTTKIMEVSSIPIEWEGRPALLAFGRDSTHRKQVEAEALQADRLAVLGMLAGGLAHSMNNPLAYVLLDLAQALEGLSALGEGHDRRDEVRARLAEAHQGATEVARVVQRMRFLSRVEDGKRGPVDVRAVLDLVLEILGNEIRHRGEIVTEIRESPPVLASRGRLEQILLHLLIHALQALPETGGGRVLVDVRGADDQVVLEVVYGASAPGLDSLSTPSAGIPRALSLTVSRRIVESLGGEMVVDATLQGETVLRVFLPSAEPGSSAPPLRNSSHVSAAPPSTHGVRVMVIDDDASVGTALGLMLAPDHVVDCEPDPAVALQRLLAGDHYDVVFCDVIMPGIGASEVYRQVADCDPDLASRFVFMTGGAYTAEARSFLRDVNNPRIEKPFDLAQVRSLVSERARRR